MAHQALHQVRFLKVQHHQVVQVSVQATQALHVHHLHFLFLSAQIQAAAAVIHFHALHHLQVPLQATALRFIHFLQALHAAALQKAKLVPAPQAADRLKVLYP